MEEKMILGIFVFLLFSNMNAQKQGGDICYNKNSSQQETQQQDRAFQALQQFYIKYITKCVNGSDTEKIKEVQKQYITPQLFDKLQKMYSEMKLDCDPFLKAQDCDKSMLEKLRIEKDNCQQNVYRVYLWDDFNKKYQEVKLLLKHGEHGYKIDNILSL